VSAAAEIALRERPILFSGPMVRAILAGKKTQTRRVISPENGEFGSAPRDYWPHGDFDRAWVDGKNPPDRGYPPAEYLHVPAHEKPRCSLCKHYGWAGTTHRLYSRVQPVWPEGWDEDAGFEPPATRLWVRETSAIGSVEGHTAYVARAERMPPGKTLADTDGGLERFIDLSPEQAAWAEQHAGSERWLPSIFMPRWACRILLEVTAVRVQRLQEISEEDAAAEGVALNFYQELDETCALHRLERLSGRTMPGPLAGRFAKAWDAINGKREPWASNPWVWAITFRRLA
jgi:hypothetical protein